MAIKVFTLTSLVVFSVIFFEAQTVGAQAGPAQGQRVIVEESDPTLDDLFAKESSTTLNLEKTIYFLIALLLVGVAVVGVLRLIFPSSKEEVIELAQEPTIDLDKISIHQNEDKKLRPTSKKRSS